MTVAQPGTGREVVGVNRDLMTWFKGSDFATGFLRSVRGAEDLLGEALCSDSGVSSLKASELIETLWGLEPSLGPPPFVPFLRLLEHGHIFYDEYRDHTAHALRVFLLGLFVYDSCQRVKAAINREIVKDLDLAPKDEGKAREEFRLRWLVAALAHDTGYILETPRVDPGKRKSLEWKTFKNKFNQILATPVSHVEDFRKAGFREPTERKLSADHGYSRMELGGARSLGIGRGRRDLLEELDEHARKAGVVFESGDSRPLLRRYYEFARSDNPTESEADRESFRDHGITSALLLMHLWNAFEERVTEMVSGVGKGDVRLPNGLAILQPCLSQRWKTVRAAAAAIALHNIDMTLWDVDELTDADLSPSRFRIWLDEQKTPSEASSPPLALAFLLRFADTLQDWDRPKFRPLTNQDLNAELKGHHLSLKSSPDSIFVYNQKDAEGDDAYRYPWKAKKGWFVRTKEELLRPLQQDAVEALFQWDLSPPTMALVEPAKSGSSSRSRSTPSQPSETLKRKIRTIVPHDRFPRGDTGWINAGKRPTVVRPLLWLSIAFAAEMKRRFEELLENYCIRERIRGLRDLVEQIGSLERIDTVRLDLFQQIDSHLIPLAKFLENLKETRGYIEQVGGKATQLKDILKHRLRLTKSYVDLEGFARMVFGLKTVADIRFEAHGSKAGNIGLLSRLRQHDEILTMFDSPARMTIDELSRLIHRRVDCVTEAIEENFKDLSEDDLAQAFSATIDAMNGHTPFVWKRDQKGATHV